MKKFLALALCLMMVCAMAAVPALAADPVVYRDLYASEVSTLNYLTTGTTWDQQVGANVIDTLVEYDSKAHLIPGLATTWEQSEDGLTWTFHLRQGVKWYDYQGNEVAEVTANDFVAAAKYLLTSTYDSSNVYIYTDVDMIQNALEYYNGTVTDFTQVGVKAVDDYTLQYTTTRPIPFFLSTLTYVCFMPAYGPQLDELGAEFATANDKMYYCGAFILSEYEPQVKHTYVKNVNNWDAANVYIDRIERMYNSESETLGPTMALRGEIDYATLSNDIIGDWKANHAELVSRGRAVPDASYFYCFNFNPKYDEQYDPASWLIAVNNSNFRHSIMSAFDRLYSMSAMAPGEEASIIQNTITPKTFSVLDGKDYTTMPAFDGIEANYFNKDTALEYKAKAVEELTKAGATFPIKMLLTYRTDMKDWENEMILLKQQLEGVLGTDYIECILYPGPSDSFLSSTRRAGMYSFMRCNWVADYVDPQTWTDPMAINKDETGTIIGNTYNRMDLMLNSDFTETKTILESYYAAAAAAIQEVNDPQARFEKFAAAEAILINNAIFVPYYIAPAEYQVTKLNIFEGEYAPCGISSLRFKGQKLYDHFITPEENAAAYTAWLEGMNK